MFAQNKQEIFILFYFILARPHMCNKNLRKINVEKEIYLISRSLYFSGSELLKQNNIDASHSFFPY